MTRRLDAELVLCSVTAALLVAMVWALPRPVDDLFVALAGGRDILAGRLGQPDDWAFTTHGRVWLDQNWGTHLLLYVGYLAGGETGLLVGKALMLVGTAAFLVGACRERGVVLPAALLVAGGAIAAARSYIDLRPNLSSIVLTPLLLWTLYRTRSRPHRVWAAALVVWLWSNAHGGFVLGIALMALWTTSWAVVVAVRADAGGRWRAVRARCSPLVTATVAAIALAALANPFGIANLTHPFVVATAPVWRNVDEWRPLFAFGATPFGTVWEFLVVVAVWLVAVAGRVRVGRSEASDDPSATALLVFDVAAGALGVGMAVQARRFVPLAILVLAPSIAMRLDAARTRALHRRLTMMCAVALLVPPALLVRPLVMRYRSDNPLYDRETMLSRMLVVSPAFPSKAVDFVKANRIGGPVLNAWETEGYLRWRETGLRLFTGSRAQQVYDPATYVEFLRLLDGDESARAALATRDVHLALIPMTPRYGALLAALVYADDARWAYAYGDDLHVVLVDTAWSGNAELVAGAQHGSLSYPDEATRALSRALCLASRASRATPEAIRDALQAAIAVRPSGIAYASLGDLATSGRIPLRPAIEYFESEAQRLAPITATGAGTARLLEARQWATTVLATLYHAAGRTQDATRRDADARTLTTDLDHLKSQWGWGDTPGFS